MKVTDRGSRCQFREPAIAHISGVPKGGTWIFEQWRVSIRVQLFGRTESQPFPAPAPLLVKDA